METEDYPDEFKSLLSEGINYMYGIVCTILGFASVLLNAVVIRMFATRKKNLSTPEYYLLNLMISSLLFMLVSCPMVAVSAFYQRWVFGHAGAVFHGMLCYFFGIVNIVSIYLVSLVRYLKTCKPHLGTFYSRRNTYLMLLGGYLYSALWAVLPLFGIGVYGMEPHRISSALDWASTALVDRVYVLLAALFVFFIPGIFMIYFYAMIMRRSHTSASAMNACISAQSVRKRKKREKVLNRIVFVVMVSFMLAWLPYTLVSLDAAYLGSYRWPAWMVAAVTIAAKLSGLTNPLVYIIVSKNYRKDLFGRCGSCDFLKSRSIETPDFKQTSDCVTGPTMDCVEERSFLCSRLCCNKNTGNLDLEEYLQIKCSTNTIALNVLSYSGLVIAMKKETYV